MKRESKTPPDGSKFDRLPSTRPVRKSRAGWAVAAGLVIAFSALVVPPAVAGGAISAGPEAPETKRPKAERHVELRKVLSAPHEVGAGGDTRRRLSAEERKALRESMRGVYEPRDSRDERGLNSRP